jgi:hypothetical protein
VIYLHTDKLYRPDKWYRRFAQHLAQRKLPFRQYFPVKGTSGVQPALFVGIHAVS